MNRIPSLNGTSQLILVVLERLEINNKMCCSFYMRYNIYGISTLIDTMGPVGKGKIRSKIIPMLTINRGSFFQL